MPAGDVLPLTVGVLGPVVAATPDGPVALGAPRPRALLAALALHAPAPVPLDRLADLVWAGRPPGRVAATVQAYVSALRKALEPGRAAAAAPTALVTVGSGYALRLDPPALDLWRFSDAVRAAAAALGRDAALLPAEGGPPAAERLAALDTSLTAAITLWRGDPFPELGEHLEAAAERGRLLELRLVAVEARARVRLWQGQESLVAADLAAELAAHPLRERLWALAALAAARAGRQAEALALLDRLRRTLADELGLEPGAEVRALQTAVLRQQVGPRPPAAPRRVPGAARPGADVPVLVGRDEPLARLRALLPTTQGPPTTRWAAVVGEPGIGKTRLVQELLGPARGAGVGCAVGRCAQDEGAAPLRPWAGVLRRLGAELPVLAPGCGEPALANAVVQQLLRLAERPLLVVLEDLHWADPASLRVLRLLLQTVDDAPLTVLLTWRPEPPPTGLRAEVAGLLARRGALRVEPAALSAEAVTALATEVLGRPPEPALLAALRERSEGLPFFVVELARWAADPAGRAALLAGQAPAGVWDVLAARLDRLPAPSRTLLAAAATLGRAFDVELLGATTGRDPDDLLDDLEPALAAGLLREPAAERFTFGHALVQEAAAGLLSASRQARLHARNAAALERLDRPDGAAAVAAQWRRAGPGHLERAWRAGVEAAAEATRLHAHEAAADELERAATLTSERVGVEQSVAGRDRAEVLLALADALRWSGRWGRLQEVVTEAVTLADRLGDARLLARAAVRPSRGALWQSVPYGVVDAGVVHALRRALGQLSPADDELRVQALLALAHELYYVGAPAERQALVDSALAMAQRLGDPALLAEAHLAGFGALWRRDTVQARLRHAEHAHRAAEEAGDEAAAALAATLRVATLAELGRLDAFWPALAAARSEAERLRLDYAQIVLDSVELSWRAMAGRFAEATALAERIGRLDARMQTFQSATARVSAQVVLHQWQERHGEVVDLVRGLARGPLPVTAIAAASLLHAGERAEAAALHAAGGLEPTSDDWLSVLVWGCAAEVAAAFVDGPLGARCYTALAPYAGQACTTGTGPSFGPVDTFLALAAGATGRHDLAARHADRALALCAAWGIPLAAERLRRQRAGYGW